MVLTFIITAAIVIMSIVVHEVSHGFAAEALGDPTARLQGRLTLNPLKHIDPIGSVVVPLVAYFAGGMIFGWAKPVIINPYNFKHRKRDELLVALAGPLSNIVIAAVFVVLAHLVSYFAGAINLSPTTALAFVSISYMVVLINFVLAFFNLIPIPPLDGSKILFALLPEKYDYIRGYLEGAGFIAIILLITVISPFVGNIASYLTNSAFLLHF